MLSPSPTQQPPASEGDKKKLALTPTRRPVGQTPTALFVKAIFRPIFKGLYYTISAMRSHKLVTLIVLVLLLASITLTNYLTTGLWPFGIANDPFNFHIHGTNGGGDKVKSWLFHLREGNVTGLQLDEKDMSQPPAPDQIIAQYSEAKNNLSWKAINVLSVSTEEDTTIDSFVEIDVVTHGPGGDSKGFLIWHFVTIAQNGGALLSVDLVGNQIRPALI
jgi:hypothetical protein